MAEYDGVDQAMTHFSGQNAFKLHASACGLYAIRFIATVNLFPEIVPKNQCQRVLVTDCALMVVSSSNHRPAIRFASCGLRLPRPACADSWWARKNVRSPVWPKHPTAKRYSSTFSIRVRTPCPTLRAKPTAAPGRMVEPVGHGRRRLSLRVTMAEWLGQLSDQCPRSEFDTARDTRAVFYLACVRRLLNTSNLFVAANVGMTAAAYSIGKRAARRLSTGAALGIKCRHSPRQCLVLYFF